MKILLTGAGFTHSIANTPLVEEVWSLIFNHPDIQNDEILRTEFLTDLPQYEETYFRLLYTPNNKIGEKQIEIVNSVMSSIFDLKTNGKTGWLDTIVDSFQFKYFRNEDASINIIKYKLDDLLDKFIKQPPFYFFTLNQDLFIERIFRGFGQKDCHSYFGFNKSMSSEKNTRTNNILTNPLYKGLFVIKYEYVEKYLIDNEKLQLEDIEKKINYIKLHGSSNWINKDDETIKIIGKNKINDIKTFKILNFYFDKFEEVVKGNDILIIGYSFRDEHINRVLATSNSLHIIDPQPASKFFSPSDKPLFKDLKNKIRGFYPYDFKEFLSNDLLFNKISINFFNS